VTLTTREGFSGQNGPGLRRLGDFELLREIGRGGMGVVYEARQVSLNRPVALKLLPPGLGLTAQAVQRFQREASSITRISFPVYARPILDGLLGEDSVRTG
jgi:serine/threonine protein kinase